MSRIHACRPAAFALALGLAASGAAFADDSSMSRLTGDSYAYFNNLDYHLGGFNTPRAAQSDPPMATTTSPDKARTKRAQGPVSTLPAAAPPKPVRSSEGA